MKYKFPRNAPRFAADILRNTLLGVHSVLGDNLIGIYLYGSLAMECFQPRSSDIDVILVVRERLSKGQRGRIIEYLKLACSNDRRVELSILREGVLRNPRYPIMVDLHYEYWGSIFENENDSEILSNLYTIRMRGFCVWGAPIGDVFSKIPEEYHLRSMIEDIEHTRKYLHGSKEQIGYDIAVYWVLTSCRILAFMREGKVLSKLEGGQWGLANLPQGYCDLVDQALSCYRGKTKDHIWDQEALEAFANHMTDAILRESKLWKREGTSHFAKDSL